MDWQHKSDFPLWLSERVWVRVVSVSLFGLVLLLAAPTLTNDRIADDFRLVGQVDLAGALRPFFQTAGTGRNERPVVRLTFAADNFLWGDRAFGYHLTNVLLHAANCVLLLLIFYRLTGTLFLAFVSATLFALHPVHHERVAWITARDGMVSTFLLLACWWSFLQSSRISPRPGREPGSDRWRRGWRVLSWCACALALFSYEGAVVLPLILLGGELVLASPPADRRSSVWKPLRATFPYFVLTACYLAWWFLVFRASPSEYGMEVSWHGLASNFYRLHYRLFHHIQHWFGLIYLVIAFLVWRERKRWGRVILFAWVVLWIGFLPFLPVDGFADRFAYFSAAGACLILGLGITAFTSTARQHPWAAPVSAAAFAVLLAGYYARSDTRAFQSWIDAGRISESILAQLKALHSSFPPNSKLLFDQMPRMHGDAYVFITGLPWAVQSKYREPVHQIVCLYTAASPSQVEASQNQSPAFHFRYLPDQEKLVEVSRIPESAGVHAQPTVTIGGQNAPVHFSGMAPGWVGLWQINAEIPQTVAPGSAVPMTLTADGVTSNTVTIAVE